MAVPVVAPVVAPVDVASLERALRSAASRFAHAPGGLWLTGRATLEALSRIDVAALDERTREQAALVRSDAERLVREGEARASEHELRGFEEWITAARPRAEHEQEFLTALLRASTSLRSRAELASAVEAAHTAVDALDRDLARLPFASDAATTIAALSARHPSHTPARLETHDAPNAPHAQGGLAEARLRVVAAALTSPPPSPSSRAFGLAGALGLALTAVAVALTHDALAVAALLAATGLVVSAGLLAASSARYAAERARELAILDGWAHRRALEVAREAAVERREKLAHAARALGRLDAFQRSEEGVVLEARDAKLPLLAPWIRATVGGFDVDAAARFHTESD